MLIGRAGIALTIRFVVAAFLLSLASGSLLAQPASSQALMEVARQALAQGRLDAAAVDLAAVDESQIDRNDLDFLRGTLAFNRKDYEAAIGYFRAILVRDPSIVRVRLDLARALFFNGEDGAAAYHFHLAEASELPPEVQANVDHFLAEIRRRRHWTLSVTAGIAPDNNVNAATVVKTISIFGQPFQLDQNAQKASGVGFVGGLGGAYQVDLTEDSRLVFGGDSSDSEYRDDKFSDRSLSSYVGPRFLLGNDSEISLKAEASRRWYGGLPYDWGIGGRIEGETPLSTRLTLDGSIDVQKLTYDQLPLNSGPVGTFVLGLTYGLDSLSFLRVESDIVREQCAYVGFRDFQYLLGVSYYRDFPMGFGVLLGANGGVARYDQMVDAFGVARHDLTSSFRIGVSNKQIHLFGFMPVITFTHTNRYSDIGLYTYERDRAEFKITSNF